MLKILLFVVWSKFHYIWSHFFVDKRCMCFLFTVKAKCWINYLWTHFLLSKMCVCLSLSVCLALSLHYLCPSVSVCLCLCLCLSLSLSLPPSPISLSPSLSLTLYPSLSLSLSFPGCPIRVKTVTSLPPGKDFGSLSSLCLLDLFSCAWEPISEQSVATRTIWESCRF